MTADLVYLVAGGTLLLAVVLPQLLRDWAVSAPMVLVLVGMGMGCPSIMIVGVGGLAVPVAGGGGSRTGGPTRMRLHHATFGDIPCNVRPSEVNTGIHSEEGVRSGSPHRRMIRGDKGCAAANRELAGEGGRSGSGGGGGG